MAPWRPASCRINSSNLSHVHVADDARISAEQANIPHFKTWRPSVSATCVPVRSGNQAEHREARQPLTMRRRVTAAGQVRNSPQMPQLPKLMAQHRCSGPAVVARSGRRHWQR